MKHITYLLLLLACLTSQAQQPGPVTIQTDTKFEIIIPMGRGGANFSNWNGRVGLVDGVAVNGFEGLTFSEIETIGGIRVLPDGLFAGLKARLYEGLGLQDKKYNLRIMAFDRHDEARAALREIAEAMGAIVKRYDFRASREVPNAVAILRPRSYYEGSGYKRLILYNPDWMKRVARETGTVYSGWSVLAHEVAHHRHNHLTEGANTPQQKRTMELEADEWSGRAMFKVGVSLEDAKAAMALEASPHDSSTHPAKHKRLQAIVEGWESEKHATEKAICLAKKETHRWDGSECIAKQTPPDPPPIPKPPPRKLCLEDGGEWCRGRCVYEDEIEECKKGGGEWNRCKCEYDDNDNDQARYCQQNPGDPRCGRDRRYYCCNVITGHRACLLLPGYFDIGGWCTCPGEEFTGRGRICN